MKCMDCKKSMSFSEAQGMFPLYRNGDICSKCSWKRVMDCRPKSNPLMEIISTKGE